VLDGVDFTEAMLERARAKGVYRSLALAFFRQTPFFAHSYDLVSVGLADDLLPELLPLYQEAARLVRPQGYLVLLGYHPSFSLSGIPATFSPCPGVLVAIEGYVHLFSEQVQAASSTGWQLRELYEHLIDEEWIARSPRAARHLGWPDSFACLWQQSESRPQAKEGRECVWQAEQGDCWLDLARGADIANESLVPGETSMGSLRTRTRRRSDTGSGIPRLHLDLLARVAKQLHTRPPMNPSTPVPACRAGYRFQQQARGIYRTVEP
jgi:SAM-dependent methyltransferase